MILLQKISAKNAVSGSPGMFSQISLSLKPLWKRILSFSWKFTHEIMPKFSPGEHCSLGISSNPEDVFAPHNFLSFRSERMRGKYSFSSMLTLLNKSLITRLESQDICVYNTFYWSLACFYPRIINIRFPCFWLFSWIKI